MSFELSEELIGLDRSQKFQKARQDKWFWVHQSHHRERDRVVAQQKRAARSGTPGQTLPARRDLPVAQVHGEVSIQNLKLVNSADRQARLQGGGIRLGDNLLNFAGRRRRRWGVLVFGAKVDC